MIEPKEEVSIYKKLLEIQKSVRGLSKDKKGYGYEYVSGNKILNLVRDKMDNLGLLLKQEVLSIENSRQDYKAKNGDKSEILSKVMMKVTWVDCETGATDESLFGANGQNDWEKGLGSALTYAERYFLLKYFHIATDEDDIDNPDRKKDSEPIKPVRVENKDELIKEFVLLATDSKEPKVLACIDKVMSFNEKQLTEMIRRLKGGK